MLFRSLEFIKINHNNDLLNTRTAYASNQTKTSTCNDYSSKRIVPLELLVGENSEQTPQAGI